MFYRKLQNFLYNKIFYTIFYNVPTRISDIF